MREYQEHYMAEVFIRRDQAVPDYNATRITIWLGQRLVYDDIPWPSIHHAPGEMPGERAWLEKRRRMQGVEFSFRFQL